MYDRNHYYLTFGGTAFTGTEQWQTGIRFAPDLGTPTDVLLAQLNAISVQDCFTALSNVIGTSTTGMQHHTSTAAKWAKLAVIKQDGEYAGAPKVYSGNILGKSGAGSGPPAQLAWAVTLGTGKTFGMAQKGRMYWPVPPTVISTLDTLTGQTGAGYDTQFRALIITALNACEGEVGTIDVSVSAAVMSKTGGRGAPTGVGTTNYVTEVSVGRALDTQRSRRTNIKEAYAYAPALRGVRDTDMRPFGRGEPKASKKT